MVWKQKFKKKIETVNKKACEGSYMEIVKHACIDLMVNEKNELAWKDYLKKNWKIKKCTGCMTVPGHWIMPILASLFSYKDLPAMKMACGECRTVCSLKE